MARITGTAAADSLVGTPEDDLIQGLDGDDLILGGRGDDLIEGGAGADTASWADAPGRGDGGGAYGVWVSLAAGLAEAVTGVSGDGFWKRDGSLERDSVVGAENATGSTRNDFVGGDAAANALRGLSGADELQSLAGDDWLFGDLGDDRLFGGDGDDALFGGRGGDWLEGGAGRDSLRAGDGGDTLLGGDGDDVASGGDGDDRFVDALLDGAEDEGDSDRYDGGGGAADTVDYGASLSGVVATLRDDDEGAEGGARQGGGEIDRLLGIENVTGSEFGDMLTGDSGANVLVGLGDDDRLYGRDGDDTLVVGSEPAPGAVNLADGGLGDDALVGWGGSDDRLFGGQGADALTGGVHALAEAPDRDTLDLGRDAAADVVGYGLARSVVGVAGGGVDRVVAFDQAADALNLDLRYAAGFGRVAVADAADFLDSDGNGILDAADRDVRGSGDGGVDLLLDLGAVWERAFGVDLPGDRPQAIVLAGVGDIGADRVAAPTLEEGWELVTEQPPDALV